MKLLLFASLAGVLLHAASLLLGRHIWQLDLFTHFQLQWLVGFLLLLVLCFQKEPQWWQSLLALYCVAILLLIWPSTFTTSSPSGGFDLYFHNVQVGTSDQVQTDQAQVIASLPVNTIALVEPSDALVKKITDLRGEPTLYHPSERGLSCAIWHANPEEVHSAAPITSPKHDPICMVAFADYDLIVIHPLPPFGAMRAERQKTTFAATQELIKQAEGNDRDWLVVGDFNSTTYSPVFRHYFSEYQTSRLYTWQWLTATIPLTIPIDYAFGSKVKSAKKLPALQSDHQAVGVVFER